MNTQACLLSDRTTSRSERDRIRAQILSELGVTPAEASLFNVIHFGIRGPQRNLPYLASCPDYSVGGALSEEVCQQALVNCLAKGWLQFIDEIVLAKIADELRQGHFLGPVYGLPDLGDIDFTHAGAEQWHRLRHHCFPKRIPISPFDETGCLPFAYPDVVHVKSSRYFRTSTAALTAIPEADGRSSVSINGPVAIGPWRAQWWRRFSEGFRLDIEERMQWQGRCNEGGVDYYLDVANQEHDQQRLGAIVDCHNVTLAEWLLLAAMENSWKVSVTQFPANAATGAERNFGIVISEAECREAFQSCLQNQWLRVIDPQAVDEVETLLENDSAFLALTYKMEFQLGQIEFTPTGADLYRMIATEWLGPDWENHFLVEDEYYREEHRYCQFSEGFHDFRYTPTNDVILEAKVIEIGPWCVNWWQRFPNGYRLELQIESR